jgi:hypothetical protein
LISLACSWRTWAGAGAADNNVVITAIKSREHGARSREKKLKYLTAEARRKKLFDRIERKDRIKRKFGSLLCVLCVLCGSHSSCEDCFGYLTAVAERAKDFLTTKVAKATKIGKLEFPNFTL